MLLKVRISVKADGRDIVELLVHSFAVERFDVRERVVEAIARNTHFAGGESVKHERVVGVGAMGDADVVNFS